MHDLESFSVPWRNQSDITELDLGYYWHSARKFVSPMIIDIIGDSESVELTQQQRTRLAGMLYTIYNRKWSKLWGVYQSEYNPIENYSMTETEAVDKDVSRQDTNTGTVNVANTGTVNDSGTEGGTISNVTDSDKTNTGTQTNSGTSSTQDGIFGFNSSTSVGSDTSDNQNSNTRTDNLASTEDITVTETRNLTDSNQRTLNTNEQETRNLANNGTENEDIERELTRSGNIGVTTSQQMLESEIALWQWSFFKQVFEDLDAIMCLPIY